MTGVSVCSGNGLKDKKEDVATFCSEDNSEDKECLTIVVITSKGEDCVTNLSTDGSSEDTWGVGTISNADVSGDE